MMHMVSLYYDVLYVRSKLLALLDRFFLSNARLYPAGKLNC